ncbi:MAG: SufD family Fe-S cluster assembly protein, partial [Mollicutes bacterium]|nr:SufD family Fe-S cluster assembly protein [Mollicutes bacterium]
MLNVVSDLKETPSGAYSIRINGVSDKIISNENVQIIKKEDKPGIDIIVKPNTINETIYIPVVIFESGIEEKVYNDFYIGENSQVKIIAGCGIHNDGHQKTSHDGIHTFNLEKNSSVRYQEKHYGEGKGTGEKVLNPVTIINLKESSYLEMESIQINGVDSTKRETIAVLDDNATLITKEIIMTDGNQVAETDFKIDLNGKNSKATISSRSVAKGKSKQVFTSVINGNNECIGHSECDAIIMDESIVKAVPDVTANHKDASLIHEAAIGKIAKDQIIKLMT